MQWSCFKLSRKYLAKWLRSSLVGKRMRMRSSHQKIGLISNKLFCWVGSLTCSHQTLWLNWTVLLSSDESCRKSVHTRKLYVNTLTLRLNWSRQFLRFWTFQSQLSRDYSSRLVRTRLRLRLTEIDPVLRYYCSTASNPQPIAAPLQRALQRSDKLATVIIKSSRLVWTRSRSDSTQPYKTENAQNYKNLQKLVVLSLVEMGRIVDVFSPRDVTRLNCFVES
jgi:hypothetical protein